MDYSFLFLNKHSNMTQALVAATRLVFRRLDWFIPAQLRLDPTAHERARFIVGLCLAIAMILILVGQ